MKNLELNVLVAVAFTMILNAVPSACFAKDAKDPVSSKPTAPANVTGTYVTGTGDLANRLRVSQLKNGHIWFFLNAYHTFHDSTGESSANMGSAQGNIPLKGSTALWKAPDGPGKLALTFSNKKCTIKQEGSDADCSFGHNVNASGSYTKISSRVIPLKRKVN